MATPYIGSFTNTSGGLWRMIHDQFQPNSGDRADVNNVCVVITDGYSNIDVELLQTYAEHAQVGSQHTISSVGYDCEIFRILCVLFYHNSPEDDLFQDAGIQMFSVPITRSTILDKLS